MKCNFQGLSDTKENRGKAQLGSLSLSLHLPPQKVCNENRSKRSEMLVNCSWLTSWLLARFSRRNGAASWAMGVGWWMGARMCEDDIALDSTRLCDECNETGKLTPDEPGSVRHIKLLVFVRANGAPTKLYTTPCLLLICSLRTPRSMHLPLLCICPLAAQRRTKFNERFPVFADALQEYTSGI